MALKLRGGDSWKDTDACNQDAALGDLSHRKFELQSVSVGSSRRVAGS